MDLIYSVNAASQDLRWGDPGTGALGSIAALGFSCTRLAVLPGQRYVYVTGSKLVGNVTTAWLAALDTCSGTIVKELDLGVGFAGQVALPGGVGGIRAYVAISEAVGSVDTGPDGGSNRVEVLNILDPADPVRLPGAIPIPGSAFGTLHIVWSIPKNTLYTTHRGSGDIFAINPLAGTAQAVTNLQQQPTGMALTQNGLVLLVGRRLAGDIVALDISGSQIASGPPFVLPNGVSQSAIYLSVDRFDRIVATSAQRLPNNTNANPNPGLVYVVELQGANAGTVHQIDAQGSWLGQPAITPDAARVFVPRGDQNDLAEIDLAQLTVSGFVGVGHSPTDAVAVDHVAGEILEVTPNPAVTTCDAPIEVTVRAFDACGVERMGVPVRPTTFAANANVSNVIRQTPATYEVQCTGNGAATITFSTVNVFPFSSVTLDVECECLTDYCLDFTSFSGGPLPAQPGQLAGAIGVSVLNAGVFQGPQIFGSELFMRHGTVRFRMPAGWQARDLLIKYTRHDALSQPEVVTVTHANGVTQVANPAVGLRRGEHEIPCLFTGIREWTVAAGAESRIREICFRAPAGLPLVF